MYDAARKAPRETCASSSSLCSSPATPTIDANQPDPVLVDAARRSDTLDSIGAWSTVQPAPPGPLADTPRPCDLLPPGIRSLDARYSRMVLAQSPQPAPLAPPEPTLVRADYSPFGPHCTAAAPSASLHARCAAMPRAPTPTDDGPDLDYSELDEAILRGRSTTLPNIFTAPSTLYRFATAPTADAISASPIPVSPVSMSTLGVLSRHGSVSVANSHRTVSPLGLSLGAIPIHQTASLDNQLSSPREGSSHASTAGRLGNPGPAAMSASFSGSGSLAGIGPGPVAPIRRPSEYAADLPPPPLSLASYSMAPGAFLASDAAAAAHSVAIAGDTINTSGASHDAAAYATRAGVHQVTSSSVAAARHGGFSHQLPTMCEDGGGSDTNPEASVLARSSSFTAAATALPLPHGPESTATSDLPAAMADADGAAYFPPRVQSLKDMRCPSFDARAGQPCDFGASDPAAAPAGLGGAASIHQSSSLSQLSGLAGLYRRHSLASANPQAAMPTGATGAWPVPRHNGVFARDAPAGAMAFGGYHPGDDYTGYPARMPTGIAYQLPMIPAGMYHFGMHPSAMVRQNSMSALPTALLQQQQQQQQQQQPGYFLGSGVSNGGLAQHHPGAMPYPGSHFSDSAPGMPMPVQPQLTQQYQQQQPASTMPPPLLPAYGPGPLAARMLQPLPMPPTMMQQGKQQNRRQSRRQRMHARRASHPEVSIPGPTAGPAGTVSPAPRLAGAPHSASHPLLPNPATTITPNMPFADMGRGLAYQSLPRGTRVYVVQFKGRRRDMFFVPSKGMEARVIPTLAPKPTSQPAAASFAAAAKGVRAASSAMAVPAPASEPAQKTGGDAKAKLAQGSYVLVEADRGVDLGVIKEELLTAEAVLAFGSALADWASGCSDGSGAGATADGSDDEHPGGAGTSTSAPAAKPPGAGGAAGRDLFVKRIFRVADRQEVADMQGNKLCDEQSALSMCQEMVQQHRLAMCVVDAEFQFDRRKLTFYFTAGRRVDFRELVRDLFRHFKTRIWMCQLNQ